MTATVSTTCFHSPIGYLIITGSDKGLHSLTFSDEPVLSDTTGLPAPLAACVQQLSEYFAGSRKVFDLPLAPAGTPFQLQVWAQLQSIPFGKTASYLDVAKGLSAEKAIRAVGAANGKNPLCLLVPCHRVIGSDGSLTGYSGGLWRKKWLLQHEGFLSPQQQLTLF
ncbi:methylated-DNA--[protein]-cysteine S-methyltransferase [Botryobacter ruber]|uniref:methylated-DNA--[protein]-cysteine S-methyltransferase n=1 Tax=Botryobacter ruber TaxID=2171629 RepID=UPI000E0AB958|nr:methylated-DNA--[protein]-cysteine S-methyltransferase [Botryobacter ruber]